MNAQASLVQVESWDDAVSEADARALNVLLVDADQQQGPRTKALLRSLPVVNMAGLTRGPHFITDLLTDNVIDVIAYDESVGWDAIAYSLREVRLHPAADLLGFVLLATKVDDETRRRASCLGMLGFVEKPVTEHHFQRALFAALGEPSARQQGLLKMMRQWVFFRGYSDRELLRLINICRVHNLAQGDSLFREGDQGRSLFVSLRGRIEISRSHDGVRQVLSLVKPGETVGEMAMVDTQPRSADARAADEVTILEIDQTSVEEIDNLLALKLTRQIAIMLTQKIRAFNSAH